MTNPFDSAVPLTNQAPASSSSNPFDQAVPVGPQRAQNVQSNDVGMARLETLSGTSGQPQAAPQPNGLGVAATAGHTALSAMGGFGSPLQAAVGYYGKAGQFLAENTPLDIPLWQKANQLNEYQNRYRQQIQEGTHGFGAAGNMGGVMASQYLLAKLLGTNSLIAPIEEATTLGAGAANKAIQSIGRIGSAALKGTAAGVPYGVQAGLTTPPENGEGLGQHVAQNVQGAMQMGAIIPGGLSALEEGYGAATAGANIGMKRLYGTQNVAIAPEVTHGESVREVLDHAATDPDLSQDQTINDIQRRSQGEQTQPDTQKAKATIQRLTAAAAAEHGVDLSLGDLSGDPQLRVQEQALEAKPGSVMNRFRAKQGSQLRSAIMNLGSDADMVTHSQPFQFEDQTSAGLPTDLTKPVPTLDLAVRDAQQARQSGQIGSNLTEPEIIAKKISDMEQNPSNPRAIQLSLEGQHWQNRQIDAQNHTEINDAITGSLEHNPDIPKTVDVNPVVSKLDDLIRQNRKSPAYSSELDSQLNAYRTNLTGGEVKDLSYDNVQHAVSSMERTIADLKEGGNRNLVQNLQQVKNLLDFQKEKFATQTLADQPDMLGKIRAASDFHKDNVVPYQDPDHGITQIIRGTDADKAVRPLFTDSSPDEFARIFGKLDPKGQDAVRAELIGRTEDSASRMKNFQDINLPGFARYLENRADQVRTAYGDDPTLSGLANLIRNTPRAGYQSKLENLFNINSAAGIGAKGVGAIGGYAVGGPVGAGVGTALEMGGELAANRAVSTHLTNPANVANYLSDDIPKLGSQLEQAPVRYAAGEVPPRSVGAAGQPSASLTEAFESPTPNPQFTMEGRAGTGYADPYARLKQLQANAAATSGDVRTAQDNYINSVLADRQLANQVKQAQTAVQTAFDKSGGTNPYGWEDIEKGDQFGATNPQTGAYVSPRTRLGAPPFAGTTTQDRAWIKQLNAAPWEQQQEVRNPTPDEMREVATRMENYIGWLKNPNRNEMPTIVDPTHPLLYRPLTEAELPSEISTLSSLRDQIFDYATKVEKGQNPPVPVQMDLINRLADASGRLKDLTQLAADKANSPINTESLANEVADAKAAQAKAFSDLVQAGPNQRQPVPANNPSKVIPTQSLTAPFTGEGSSINNPRGIQTATRGIVPQQSLSSMAEPYQIPQSGTGLSSFDQEGNKSVGAAERPKHNQMPGAASELDRLMAQLRAKQAGTIQGQPPAQPLSDEEAMRTFNTVNADMENPLQKAARQLAEAQEIMRTTGIQAADAAREQAVRELNRGLVAPTPPNSQFTQPHQAIPTTPDSTSSQIKQLGQQMGIIPPEPEGNPQSHTLGTAAGSLEEQMMNLQRNSAAAEAAARAKAPGGVLNGPNQNRYYGLSGLDPSVPVTLSQNEINPLTGKQIVKGGRSPLTQVEIDEAARAEEIKRPGLAQTVWDGTFDFGQSQENIPTTAPKPATNAPITEASLRNSALQDYMKETAAKRLDYNNQIANAQKLNATSEQLRKMKIEFDDHIQKRVDVATEAMPLLRKQRWEDFDELWGSRP